MPSNREEEYEVNLGNKQLLALFFIVVGFFALFFSVGYVVGFGHGEGNPTELAQVERPAPAPEPAEPRLPAALREDPPEPPPVVPAPATQQPESPKPPPVVAAPPTPVPTPAPVRPSAPPKAQTKPSPSTPAPRAAAPAPQPTAAAAAPAAPSQGGEYFLQVAAVRVEADAAELAGKLKAKGYPAVVNAGKGDGWQRVVVGPFASAEAASSFKAKLSKDGFDTMLRKL